MPKGNNMGRVNSVRNSTASINIDIIFVSIMFSILTTMLFTISKIVAVMVFLKLVIKKTYDVL